MIPTSSWSTCWDLISEMQLRSAAARDSADAPNAAEQKLSQRKPNTDWAKKKQPKKDELVYKSKQVPSPN